MYINDTNNCSLWVEREFWVPETQHLASGKTPRFRTKEKQTDLTMQSTTCS